MDALNLPRPAWMSEDLVLLEEQARRFIADEFVPHLDRWHEAGMYDRDVWTKAGAAGLLCASMPEEYGGAGGSFAHEAVINREFSLAGFDTFGAPLHSGIVAPYILHYGTEEQKKRWLPKLATGELVGAIAMTEPGTGSDLQGVRATGEEIRQRLRAQRLQDLHHQRPARQSDHRRRQDRSEGGRQGHLADGGGDRRRARLPARPQAQEARHGFRRHLGTVLRRRAACRHRACSAPRRGRASIS